MKQPPGKRTRRKAKGKTLEFKPKAERLLSKIVEVNDKRDVEVRAEIGSMLD